jgi:hypothetical protein
MKIIGKPYSGKPNVRFDEGELEIEPSATTPALYSTVIRIPLSCGLLPCNVVFTFLFHYAIVQMEISGIIYDGIRKLFPDFEILFVS